ncbi:MAG: SDR family NAD(P)-dependent oxidoreductase [Alphaproteobacteria bacterium]
MSSVPTIVKTVFDEAAQRAFGGLCGDFNPIHVDPVYSRKVGAGRPIVHGVHLVLWSIEALLEQCEVARIDTGGIAKIAATFRRPVYIGTEVEASVDLGTADAVVQIGQAGNSCAEVRVSFGAIAASASPGPAADYASPGGPRPLAFAEVAGREGRFTPRFDAGVAGALFARTLRVLGGHTLAELAGLSYLVGMECPGLFSLLSGFSVENRPRGRDAMEYRVVRADERFNLVRMRVSGGQLDGQVDAFLRPQPRQPSMAEISGHVGRAEFVGQTALVVGGSRGIGEVTAKTVAAGGGRVVLTYVHGRDDAARVMEEIRAAGGGCEILQFDVRSPDADLKAIARHGPTHMYYFATPPIFVRRPMRIDERLLEDFWAVYVRGFSAVCGLVDHLEAGRLRIFYPSSVAVETPVAELAEYAMAKAAGEVLCRILPMQDGRLSTLVHRLPRILTDQTATVLNVPSADALATMLPIIREFHAS